MPLPPIPRQSQRRRGGSAFVTGPPSARGSTCHFCSPQVHFMSDSPSRDAPTETQRSQTLVTVQPLTPGDLGLRPGHSSRASSLPGCLAQTPRQKHRLRSPHAHAPPSACSYPPLRPLLCSCDGARVRAGEEAHQKRLAPLVLSPPVLCRPGTTAMTPGPAHRTARDRAQRPAGPGGWRA